MSLKGSREWWEDNGLYHKGWGSNSDSVNCHDWEALGGSVGTAQTAGSSSGI